MLNGTSSSDFNENQESNSHACSNGFCKDTIENSSILEPKILESNQSESAEPGTEAQNTSAVSSAAPPIEPAGSIEKKVSDATLEHVSTDQNQDESEQLQELKQPVQPIQQQNQSSTSPQSDHVVSTQPPQSSQPTQPTQPPASSQNLQIIPHYIQLPQGVQAVLGSPNPSGPIFLTSGIMPNPNTSQVQFIQGQPNGIPFVMLPIKSMPSPPPGGDAGKEKLGTGVAGDIYRSVGNNGGKNSPPTPGTQSNQVQNGGNPAVNPNILPRNLPPGNISQFPFQAITVPNDRSANGFSFVPILHNSQPGQHPQFMTPVFPSSQFLKLNGTRIMSNDKVKMPLSKNTIPSAESKGAQPQNEETSQRKDLVSEEEKLEIARALVRMSTTTPGVSVAIKPSRRLRTKSAFVIPDLLCSTPYKYILEISFPEASVPSFKVNHLDIYLSTLNGKRYEKGMSSLLQRSEVVNGVVRQVYLIQFLVTSFKNKGLRFVFHVDRIYSSTPFKLVARKQKIQNDFWDKHLSSLPQSSIKNNDENFTLDDTEEAGDESQEKYNFADQPEKACAEQLVNIKIGETENKKRKRDSIEEDTLQQKEIKKERREDHTIHGRNLVQSRNNNQNIQYSNSPTTHETIKMSEIKKNMKESSGEVETKNPPPLVRDSAKAGKDDLASNIQIQAQTSLQKQFHSSTAQPPRSDIPYLPIHMPTLPTPKGVPSPITQHQNVEVNKL